MFEAIPARPEASVFGSSGEVLYSDANGSDESDSTIGSYETGRLCPIMLSFDMDAGTYDVWWDGMLVLDDETHAIAGRGVGSIVIGTDSDVDLDGRFYVDQISVRSAEACPRTPSIRYFERVSISRPRGTLISHA